MAATVWVVVSMLAFVCIAYSNKCTDRITSALRGKTGRSRAARAFFFPALCVTDAALRITKA